MYGFRDHLTELETILIGDPYKIISKTYNFLLKMYTADEQVKDQMIKWALNVNAAIEMDQWEHLWKKSIKISACTNIQENCYKLLYRWYMTPKKLSKIYRASSNLC